jgi:TfoX/Sxy family transcriptional regulator of competence genes
MQWKKSPPALVELFSAVVPGAPAEQRKMFGYPAAFVNGNLFMSLYQDDFILRLPDQARAKLLKIKGARPFEPMPGRAMKEYVVAPGSVVKDQAVLRKWIGASLEYAMSLPPKKKKAKSSRARRG